MSLGPAGLSMNAEQAENFEDVRHPAVAKHRPLSY